MGLTPTLAALFGSIATAIAIFGGGLAVEAYKRRQDRMGMALALAGAIDAMLGLIETRNMTSELWEALSELEAGRQVEFGSLIHDNAPFQAITLSYANQTRHMPLQALADEVHRSADAFLDMHAGRMHIVTHSLGGLLARALVTRGRPPRLGRVVMLGPPSAGSELADKLSRLAPYRWAFGPVGRQLVTRQDDALRQLLGEVDYALGIIAGTRSVDPLGWMLIPRPNDGRVSVARTKVAGMADHLTLPVTHAMMMCSPVVIRQTLHFLEHARFIHSLPRCE